MSHEKAQKFTVSYIILDIIEYTLLTFIRPMSKTLQIIDETLKKCDVATTAGNVCQQKIYNMNIIWCNVCIIEYKHIQKH